MLRDLVNLIRDIYSADSFIYLHQPQTGRECKSNIMRVMDAKTLALGRFVHEFEQKLCEISKARFAIATNSGTAALNLALMLHGIGPFDHVVTQSFTYISTANAIRHVNATPAFVDVDRTTLSMCPESLGKFLEECEKKDINACMPMFTLGNKPKMDEIRKLCRKHNIPIIVDACQAIMTDNFFEGETTCLSFNGNKTITTGGGGAILTNDPDIEMEARKLLNQIGPMEEVWYNYRMPNINAAIGCGMMAGFDFIRAQKLETAKKYHDFAQGHGLECVTPLVPWLNAFLVEDPKYVKEYLSNNLIDSRLGFPLVNELPMYKSSVAMDYPNSTYIKDHIIMLPSGVYGSY